MESFLFMVLGIIGGAIASFAITYFTLVSKLQKKLTSTMKKLDRALSANEGIDALQSQLEAQKHARQAAESQLVLRENDHQAQIINLEAQHAAALEALQSSKDAIEAELNTLKESSVLVDQSLTDNSNLAERRDSLTDAGERLTKLSQSNNDQTSDTIRAETVEGTPSTFSQSRYELEVPDTFAVDRPSWVPGPDIEEILTMTPDGDDDLDFLLQLQEDDPLTDDEFLPAYDNTESLSAGFPAMERLADDSSELSEHLRTARPPHEGDPFINVLDESPDSSDNDLLALLQKDGGEAPPRPEEEDDIFLGLEEMLYSDTPDHESELDDLDALFNIFEDPETEREEVFSSEAFDLGEEDP